MMCAAYNAGTQLSHFSIRSVVIAALLHRLPQ
jgi:hypothetical protein